MTPPIDLPIGAPASASFDDSDTAVERTVTDAGTRIITQAVPATRSVGISLWVPVGSRDEAPRHAGSTHFLEHLLFKGTGRRSALDIAVAFDSVGGESNAETAREHTAYWARILGDDLDMAVRTLVDMVADSRLDPADFDMERGVILDELAMSEDSPTEVVHDAFQLAVHGDTPLGRPIGGTPDAIRAVTRDDVHTHYRHHYGPDALVVAAAGAVDHARLAGLVADALADSSWADAAASSRPSRPRRPTAAPAPLDHEHEIVRRRDVEQAHLIVGTRGMRANHDDGPVMSVLLSVLGGGMSSRLFQEVREKRGLAYTTYAFESAYSDTGSFGMYAGTSPDRLAEVERIMIGQLEDLASDGPTDDELARVRGQVRGSVALGLEDNWSRMMRLGRAEVSGRYRTVAETLDAIDAVTADQVRGLAARLARQTRARALVLPRD
ncbi:insulinase family protein [Actinomyces sp. B33]|uniref:M16 family metallopeptidase n=1 Tax=Actinomyces sp. B33 TaxID=2942131 RepID=UPI002340FB82|nr:pitrilysin family protein [Actinomyces sp. B33]MDC4233029.1 insulinase family protein [Actinomyces sp. B33]